MVLGGFLSVLRAFADFANPKSPRIPPKTTDDLNKIWCRPHPFSGQLFPHEQKVDHPRRFKFGHTKTTPIRNLQPGLYNPLGD